MKLTIRTNHHPRPILYGYELTTKEREEFDYLEGEELNTHQFVRYQGIVYDLSEFVLVPRGTCAPDGIDQLQNWDAWRHDSAFSGVLLRYVDDYEQVTMGTYCS